MIRSDFKGAIDTYIDSGLIDPNYFYRDFIYAILNNDLNDTYLQLVRFTPQVSVFDVYDVWRYLDKECPDFCWGS